MWQGYIRMDDNNNKANSKTTKKKGDRHTRYSHVRSETRTVEQELPVGLLTQATRYFSTVRLLIITIALIFFVESIALFLFTFLPPISSPLELLLHTSLLIIMVLLPLYFFVLHPMILKHRLLEDKLHSLSLTDELTGLYNRRGLFAFAKHALKMARREQKGLSLLYADMDNLKEINDALGHKTGDKALVEIANILKTNYRHSDIVARIGGDAFIVIPVSATRDGIDLVTNRLERKLNIHNAEDNGSYKLSLSSGAVYNDSGFNCSVDDMLVRAEELMYEQKMAKKKSSSKEALISFTRH